MKVRFEVNLSTLGKQEVPKTTKYTANCTNGPLQRENYGRKEGGKERYDRGRKRLERKEL